MIICKVCGTQNERGASFCGNCGSFLEWEGEVVEPAPTGAPTGDAATQPLTVPPSATGGAATAGPGVVTEPVPSPPPNLAATVPGGVTCPVCGTVNEPDRVYCRRCATELRPAVAPEPAPLPPGPPRRLPPTAVVAAGAAVVVLVAVVGGVAMLGRGDSGGSLATTTPDTGLVTSPSAGVASDQPSLSAPASEAPSEPAPPSAPPTPTGRVVFASDDGSGPRLVIMDPDGGNVVRLDAGDDIATDPYLSPDGTQVVYRTNAGLRIRATDGSGRARVLTRGGSHLGPAWSPDGSTIAFVDRSDGDYDIVTIPAAGGATTRITRNRANDFDPTWSPDGSQIAFVSDRDGDREIWVMDADGSHPVQLTHNDVRDDDPAWSPDGSTIAFSSERNGKIRVYLMGADGSRQRRLPGAQPPENDEAWSPDGQFLAIVHGSGAGATIAIVGIDGKRHGELGLPGESARVPDW